MVDREIFSRRLEALRGYLRKLGEFRDSDDRRALDPPRHRGLTGSDESLDRREVSGHAGQNKDTFTVLERAGEIAPDLAERMRGWAGFRNILVHEYLEIDHAIAYRAIRDELGDLEALADWATGKL